MTFVLLIYAATTYHIDNGIFSFPFIFQTESESTSGALEFFEWVFYRQYLVIMTYDSWHWYLLYCSLLCIVHSIKTRKSSTIRFFSSNLNACHSRLARTWKLVKNPLLWSLIEWVTKASDFPHLLLTWFLDAKALYCKWIKKRLLCKIEIEFLVRKDTYETIKQP